MERLIHADGNRAEVGVITDFQAFDAQIHHNCELADNTFSLTMSVGAWQAEKILRGDFVYINGSEFGGLVRSVSKNTTSDTVIIKGADNHAASGTGVQGLYRYRTERYDCRRYRQRLCQPVRRS